MPDEAFRLLRLARTQSEFARLLEVKVVAARHHVGQLEQTRAGVMSALDRAGGTGLVLYAATMRRLNDISVTVKAREVELAELNRTLLKVRLRQEVLTRRAEEAKWNGDRKTIELEVLEVSLGMQGKATGKHGVIK